MSVNYCDVKCLSMYVLHCDLQFYLLSIKMYEKLQPFTNYELYTLKKKYCPVGKLKVKILAKLYKPESKSQIESQLSFYTFVKLQLRSGVG